MRKSVAGVTALLVVFAGCRSARVETEPTAQPAPRPATADEVPAGTLFDTQLNETLGTRDNRVGDRFTATIRQPLIAQNGQVVVPEGARVHGVITGLDDSDHIGDQAAIRLNFERITFRGESHPFAAEVVSTDAEVDGEARRAAESAAAGAVAGAALGAIIGGDLRDILVGGALGAGAGTIVSLGVGRVDASLPAGTPMQLRTTQNISLR